MLNIFFQNASIHYWLEKGCPSKKINLGLAIYGRSFTLTNDSVTTDVGAETSGGGLGIENRFLFNEYTSICYFSWTIYKRKWYFSIF